jgi:hypothetical protein
MNLEKRIERLEQARQSAQDSAYRRTPDSVIEERLRQIEACYLHNVPLPKQPEGKVRSPFLNVTSSSVIEERLRQLGFVESTCEKSGNDT